MIEADYSDDIDLLENENLNDAAGPALVGVRCAAHTLQLAVEDTLNKTNVSDTIANARNLAIELRTPNIAMLLQDLKLPIPPLDCPTRFGLSVSTLMQYWHRKLSQCN